MSENEGAPYLSLTLVIDQNAQLGLLNYGFHLDLSYSCCIAITYGTES